jgi:hypothetical protein
MDVIGVVEMFGVVSMSLQWWLVAGEVGQWQF